MLQSTTPSDQLVQPPPWGGAPKGASAFVIMDPNFSSTINLTTPKFPQQRRQTPTSPQTLPQPKPGLAGSAPEQFGGSKGEILPPVLESFLLPPIIPVLGGLVALHSFICESCQSLSQTGWWKWFQAVPLLVLLCPTSAGTQA